MGIISIVNNLTEDMNLLESYKISYQKYFIYALNISLNIYVLSYTVVQITGISGTASGSTVSASGTFSPSIITYGAGSAGAAGAAGAGVAGAGVSTTVWSPIIYDSEGVFAASPVTTLSPLIPPIVYY